MSAAAKRTDWKKCAAIFAKVVTRKMGGRSTLSSSTILVRTSEREPAVRTLYSVFMTFYPDCPLTQETFWDAVGRRVFKSNSPQRMITVRYNNVKTKLHPFVCLRPMASATGQASVQSQLRPLANAALPAKICTEAGMEALVTFSTELAAGDHGVTIALKGAALKTPHDPKQKKTKKRGRQDGGGADPTPTPAPAPTPTLISAPTPTPTPAPTLTPAPARKSRRTPRVWPRSF